jgi:hypothetical protein
METVLCLIWEDKVKEGLFASELAAVRPSISL